MEKQQSNKALVEKEETKYKANFFSLFKYSDWKDLVLIFLGITGAIVHGAVPSFFSLLFGDVINAFSGSSLSAQEGVLVVVYNFLILAAVSVVSAYIQITCLMISGQRQSNRIRNLYFRSVVSQEMEWHDSKKSGDLVNLIGGDMVQIQEAISERLGSFFQFTSTFISGFVIGFIEGWQLSLVTFSMVPLIALTGGISSFLLSRFSSQGSDANGKVGSVAQQAIGNIKTVASLTGEETEKKNYYNATYENLLTGIKKSHSAGFGYGSILLFSTGSFSLTFWYGYQLVAKGVMGPGDVITVLLGIFIGATSLGQASPSVTAFAVGVSSAQKVFEIIDKKSKIDSFSNKGIKPETVKGQIVFENVHFRYPSRPEQKVLNGMSFRVDPGQTIAFVGHSGCGKSTSIGLLQRFYDFEDGKITIDGHDIRDLSISWLRDQIGVVSQEPILFARSIADNISCGKENAPKEKIIQAAKDANIHDFIVSLPEGYNTVLGERGTQLSGGQKQRIAIARAIYKNPTILLLDEATSALDNKSERVVQDALEKASEGRTTIVIAHRLSTIQNSDIIYVVESGKVIEQGKHEELMSKETHSLYQDLIKAQQKPKAVEETVEEEEEEHENNNKNENSLALPNKSESKKLSSSHRYEDFDLEMQDENKVLKRSNRIIWLKLFKMNAPEVFYLLVGNFGAAVTGVANPLFSVIFSRIIAQMAQGEEGGYSITFWCLMFLVLAVGSGISGYLQTSMLSISGEKLAFRIKNKMFESIIKQEVAWFDKQENSSGILTNRLSSDATLVKSATGEKIGWFVQVLSSLISSLVIALIPCWEVALLVLSCVPLITIGSVLELQLIIGFNKKAKKFYEESGRTASEAITNIKTVASLGLESDFMKLYEKSVEKADNQTTKTSFIAGAGYSFGTSVQNLIWPATFYFGAWLVDNQRCTFGGMMEAISSIFFTALYFGEAFITVSSIGKSLQAARNIFQIIEKKSLVDPTSKEGTLVKEIKGEIEFKNVHFSYPTRPGVPVLKGFNLKIKPGETVALVGASGCGKSTCVGLLERFYTPDKGKILIDGQDISTMNLRSLRSKIGLVSQEPVLFDMSIKENILYSISEPVEEDKIEKVCKEANVYDFVQDLPDHLNTQVGERGSKLSGGQKQRVAIARALIRDPSILLLDEATSALDTESEKIVQEALDRARNGRTTLIIAHRLSTIRSANQIVVVEEGKVVEKGTHDELMAAKSTYFTLVQSSFHGHGH